MRLKTLIPCALLALPAMSAVADDYDYEIDLGYINSSGSADSTTQFNGGSVTASSDIDVDDIAVSGSWYFDTVDTSKGPLERAAFLSRASFLSIGVTQASGDTTLRITSTDPGIPDVLEESEQDGDTVSIGGRYVFNASNWFVDGAAAFADLETDTAFGSVSVSADAYAVSLGRYFGDRTTVSLGVVVTESSAGGTVFGGDSSDSDLALAVTHLGMLGDEWQYGVDAAATTDSVGRSDGSLDLRLALYPNRAFSFGAEYRGGLLDSDEGPRDYGVFLSWFATGKLGIEAVYRWADIEAPVDGSADSDGFGAAVVFRF